MEEMMDNVFHAIRNDAGRWAEFKTDGTVSWTDSLEFAFKFFVEEIASTVMLRDYPGAQIVKVFRNKDGEWAEWEG